MNYIRVVLATIAMADTQKTVVVAENEQKDTSAEIRAKENGSVHFFFFVPSCSPGRVFCWGRVFWSAARRSGAGAPRYLPVLQDELYAYGLLNSSGGSWRILEPTLRRRVVFRSRVEASSEAGRRGAPEDAGLQGSRRRRPGAPVAGCHAGTACRRSRAAVEVFSRRP